MADDLMERFHFEAGWTGGTLSVAKDGELGRYEDHIAKEEALQSRIKELEADNKGLRHMILDQINSTGDDPEIIAATRAEWAARALMAEDRLNAASKMLPRAIIAIHKGRKQEAIDVLETAIEELKGGSDG